LSGLAASLITNHFMTLAELIFAALIWVKFAKLTVCNDAG